MNTLTTIRKEECYLAIFEMLLTILDTDSGELVDDLMIDDIAALLREYFKNRGVSVNIPKCF